MARRRRTQLTDAPRASSPVVEAKPVAQPPPPRTRVGDLLGSSDSDSSDSGEARDKVSFPSAVASTDDDRPADRPEDRREDRHVERPPATPPPSKPPAADGSLIAVDEKREEPRPSVASFDDLGSAVEEELARDTSVPPASSRRGPDLASRFGPADEPADPPKRVEEKVPDPVDEDEETEEVEDFEEIEELEVSDMRPRKRNVGAVVAIWIFTAVTSGGIAALHFTGII